MAFKMYGKSPMMKALIGKQENLPEELKAKILASPAKMYGKSPKKNYMKMDKYSKSGDAVQFGDSPKKMYGKKKNPGAFKKELPKSLKDKINKFSPYSTATHTPMGKLRKGYRGMSDMTSYTPSEVKLIKASKTTGTK